MPELTHLRTVGHAAMLMQLSPEVIESALKALGAGPCLVLNDLPYYGSATILEAMEALCDTKPVPAEPELTHLRTVILEAMEALCDTKPVPADPELTHLRTVILEAMEALCDTKPVPADP